MRINNIIKIAYKGNVIQILIIFKTYILIITMETRVHNISKIIIIYYY